MTPDPSRRDMTPTGTGLLQSRAPSFFHQTPLWVWVPQKLTRFIPVPGRATPPSPPPGTSTLQCPRVRT